MKREHVVIGMSYRQGFGTARWRRQHRYTHLYFAEHVGGDWRFALYRALAGVRILVDRGALPELVTNGST